VIVTTPNVLSVQSRLRTLAFGFPELFDPLPLSGGDVRLLGGHIHPISPYFLVLAALRAGLEEPQLHADRTKRSSAFWAVALAPILQGGGLVHRRKAGAQAAGRLGGEPCAAAVDLELATAHQPHGDPLGAQAGRAPRTMSRPLEILYEDEDLLVVDKPSGLLSVPTPNASGRTVIDALREQGREALAVHRIDRDVSGALLLARNEDVRDALDSGLSRAHRAQDLLGARAGRHAARPGRVQGPDPGRRLVRARVGARQAERERAGSVLARRAR
jgi:hypothetical protein